MHHIFVLIAELADGTTMLLDAIFKDQRELKLLNGVGFKKESKVVSPPWRAFWRKKVGSVDTVNFTQ